MGTKHYSDDITVGTYVRARIVVEETSQNVINNTTNLNIKIQMWRTNTGFTTEGNITVYIKADGFEYTHETMHAKLEDSTKVQVGERDLTITHGSNGKWNGKVYVYSTSSATQNLVIPESNFSPPITDIDRSAPTVTHSISNITSSGFKISAVSSTTSDVWSYSIDGGSNYTQFSTTAGTTASVTLSNLSANTTYQVRVKARKKSNRVYGYSTSAGASTLGGTVITSASTITADNATVTVGYEATVYNSSFYHKLSIKNGGTTILTTSAFQLTSGTSSRTYNLTSDQRTALLTAMSSIKSFTATLSLATYTTYACTTQVGSASTKTCTCTTTESNSAPTFSSFSYTDVNEILKTITGSSAYNTVMVQSYSSLYVTATAGTAKNCSSIVSYSASIGTAAKTSTSTSIQVGQIGSYGDLTLTVTCTDSRGYSTSASSTVKVLQYEKPKCYSYTLMRKNEIEDVIQLSMNGTFSLLIPSENTNVNSLKYAGFYYKKTNEDEWSSYVSFLSNVVVNTSSYSFTSTKLMIDDNTPLSLDTNSTYDFHIVIRDQLDSYSSCDIYDVIPQGAPIVSLRKRGSFDYPRVGINNPNPVAALDVIGDASIDGDVLINEDVGVSGDAIIVGDVTVGGTFFATNIGAVSSGTNESVSQITTGTETKLSSLSLDAGVYIVFGSFMFGGNAQGYRTIWIGTGSTDKNGEIDIPSCGSATMSISTSTYFKLTEQKTIYLYCYQSSGSSISISSIKLKAVRVI